MDQKIKHAGYRSYQGMMRVASGFVDWSQPDVLRGAGCVKKLAVLLMSRGVSNALVVTDKGLVDFHLIDGLLEELRKEKIKYTLYDGVQPNPTVENVEEARQLFLDAECDAIVAFGGGSPMDCAKAAGARISNPNTPVQKLRGQLKVYKRPPLLFAVPTTAGSGSEATVSAVVLDEAAHEKYAINDPKLRPKYVVLDPELTVGLPPHITAITGMDALTHAVESYIGRSNTKQTRGNAEKAVKLIFENLEKAYQSGENMEARENMLIAAYHAGLAFTRAYVGYVHAIAHAIGGLYGTPHGLATAVILPYVLDYYGESVAADLDDLAELVGIDRESNGESPHAFITAIREMSARMDIPETFDVIKDEDVALIVSRALEEANPLYPVPKIMDAADCETIIRQIMGN
ncbi:MAG: iron-containing alcohol dehydrogenase [Oscillospiraceae bacterium]|nr:iron-containing alcohol dehydrogenase [Oscillospiraceae bacterium]